MANVVASDEHSDRILVAEDNAWVREVLCSVLKQAGYVVDVHPDGEGALAALERATAAPMLLPKLVLTDVRMPGCGGLALLKEVKARWPELPVVLMTAFGERDVLREAIQHGCDGYLDKPFTPNELTQQVRKSMECYARIRASLQETRGRRDGTDTVHAAASAAEPAAPVKRLENFQILGEIARGGMGVVYKARQLDLDRVVALKVHRHSGGHTDGLAHRFLREARAMAGLRHANIAVVHEVGAEEGVEYFTMEYVEGVSLDQRLRRGPLSPAEAVALLTPVADGLAHAHGLGILHRDVKPANIVIDPDGRSVLVDFGIAIRKGDRGQPEDERYLEGTMEYMAPEYGGGGSYDELCDQYSFGVVLYEALAGRGRLPYWDGRVPSTLLAQGPGALRAFMEQRGARPLTRVAQVSEALAEVIARATDLDAARRYPSMHHLVEELARAGRAQGMGLATPA